MDTNKNSNWFDKWGFKTITLILIPLVGSITTIIITNNQNNNANDIAYKQNKLFLLQMFKDKLTGGRVTREMSLKTIEVLDDTNLTNKLREISDIATIKMLRDSIWNPESSVKENAIIEYARLYNNKKYRSLILDALMPDYYHLEDYDPLISITKFFYYLTIVSDGKWYGTKKDSAQFATIETSEWYNKPLSPYNRVNNIHKYYEYCKKGFVLDTTLDYKGTDCLNLIRVNYGN